MAKEKRVRVFRKTRLVRLEGDYAGVEVEVLTEPPFAYYDLLAQITEFQVGDIGANDPAALRTMLQLSKESTAMILRGWNLDDEDGSPIPCTVAGLSKVSPEFLRAVTDAVKQEQLPKAPSDAPPAQP